ncbi:nad(P)-binding protein [Stemphylium lycopersici]|uniref:Nad(P)-binding protein n=1 Tax=Stemphylium lycopersici TaxID=183478 RepID=A0A364N2Q1_STELY|nr:nad(P)-binding protein [Stemphylium lycopersici]RAR10254.1 nad(P)-binding protein [Stemphylium lycopersici]
MSQCKTIVVTGSNRGIGQGIIKLLAKTQHAQPLRIYATSRSGTDLSVQPNPPNEILYKKLDVSDKSSITFFLSTVLQNSSKIDVLINNAGVNNNSNETPDLASQTINVNYHGTRDMCSLFLTQGNMSTNPGSRIVNVSSAASDLSNYPLAMQARFRRAESIEDVDALAKEYLAAVQSDSQEAAGFGAPPMSYQVSKALMNALTMVLARENKAVDVNCCCPGWVDSDMGNQIGKPPKTLEEGARIPVRLAIGDLSSAGDGDGGLGQGGSGSGNGKERVSGGYFGNDGVMDRGWGRVRKW